MSKIAAFATGNTTYSYVSLLKSLIVKSEILKLFDNLCMYVCMCLWVFQSAVCLYDVPEYKDKAIIKWITKIWAKPKRNGLSDVWILIWVYFEN